MLALCESRATDFLGGQIDGRGESPMVRGHTIAALEGAQG